MAAVSKVTHFSRNFNLLCRTLNNLKIDVNALEINNKHVNLCPVQLTQCRFKQSYTTVDGLKEFFDSEENWGAPEVKVGRAWRKEELRIKSNSDLHKLWYVLLKERNMLMTMEQECNDQWISLPNPERVDKVEESMENLEAVVCERNKAYHELETGEKGERPGKVMENIIGIRSYYRMTEQLIPKFANKKWKKTHHFDILNRDPSVDDFLKLYREKLSKEKQRKAKREFNHVCGLIKRFPNLDMEAVKAQYPGVDIEKAKNSKRSRGHYVPA